MENDETGLVNPAGFVFFTSQRPMQLNHGFDSDYLMLRSSRIFRFWTKSGSTRLISELKIQSIWLWIINWVAY
jgi:hypothetical protein